MSDWSIALEEQSKLWHFCSNFTNFDDMRKRAWVHKNLAGEMVAHDPEFFGDGKDEGGNTAKGAQDVGFWLLQQPLSLVTPYYFTEPTCRMLHEAAASFPMTSSYPAETRFMSPAGFWYFANPIGTMVKIDAEERGIRALLWMRHHDGLAFAACLDDPKALLPAFFSTWPRRYSIEESVAESRPLIERGGYPPDEVDWFMAVGIKLQQFLGAALTFCHQRIFLDSLLPADRPTRRRVQAITDNPMIPADVHVITLRRPEPKEPEESREVDWHWRWWVRGHWRQQAVGVGHSERAPVWIMSHVKGPEDRPMKPSVPTVYRVAR